MITMHHRTKIILENLQVPIEALDFCKEQSKAQKPVLNRVMKTKAKLQTFDMVNAGLHCSLRMSRHILPLLLMLGWKTLVLKAT